MSMILDHAKVITPTDTLNHGTVIVGDEGRIVYAGPAELSPHVEGIRLDLHGLTVVPGLIDIHVHGGNGITFGKADSLVEDLENYSSWVVKNGVTGFLTTIAAPEPKSLAEIIEASVEQFERGLPGAKALGIHLEGPFLNVEKKGAQNPAWVHDPCVEEAELYLRAGRGWIKQVTMAPELSNADEVAAVFRKAGVSLAIGHSLADYETTIRAFAETWTHVTHTYNAQTGLHHRQPGVVGALLTSDEITAELIADLIHVHPAAMEILVRCIGTDRVVLITDAMEAAGLPDGEYALLGAKVIVSNGMATQEDGTIAGSSAVLNRCVYNIHNSVGISLPDAIKMATLSPARVIGEASRRGSIEVGKQADLIVVDDEMNVYMTMVNGKVVYRHM